MNMITNYFSRLEPGQMQHIAGLTLFPLMATVKGDLSKLKTFDELADLGLAQAVELGGSANVTKINIENSSDYSLLLLDGEGVTGAKQNRMMQRSVIIAPHTCNPVPVNCVEQGRWSYRGSSNFEKAEFSISPKMRDIKGELLKTKEDSKVQGAMWDEISVLERKLGAHSPTKDLDEIITSKQQVSSYEIRNFVRRNPCYGFLVFGSGRPFVELFGREDLCEKFVSKSIRTWIADADNPSSKKTYNAYHALNHLLLSEWVTEASVCSEEVKVCKDESNGRCILMNGNYVHGYYYMPSHSFH